MESVESEKRSLGFMELLGLQDLGPSIFDTLQLPIASTQPSVSAVFAESSDQVFNHPSTPNSSSISSESTDHAPNDELTKEDGDEDDDDRKKKTNNLVKPKKQNQKRQKEPRIAFMTKSQVDHLEDGYRWRKYGQKAVKNSSFPRSYYRCTSGTCNVKKRVERCFTDPSIVITTYEGKHTHHTPIMPLLPTPPIPTMQPTITLPHRQPNFPTFNSSHFITSTTRPIINASHHHQTPSSALLGVGDQGLLQDIVPSLITNEE